MKNWRKLDYRSARVLARRMGMNAQARRNLLWMLGEIKAKGYTGLYQITTKCACGSSEKIIICVKTLSGHMKELHDADQQPKVMCSKCQGTIAAGVMVNELEGDFETMGVAG